METEKQRKEKTMARLRKKNCSDLKERWDKALQDYICSPEEKDDPGNNEHISNKNVKLLSLKTIYYELPEKDRKKIDLPNDLRHQLNCIY